MKDFAFVQEIAADLSRETVVFPTSFDTTLRLRQVLHTDDAPIPNVAAIVARDPLVSARVIQTANSTLFNPSGQSITTIPSAVTRIGTNAVRVLALSVAMQQLRTYKQMAAYDEMCSAVMLHSRWIAGASYVLARKYTRIAADTALFTGLVHDIGFFYLIYRISQHAELALSEDEIRELVHHWHESIGHAVLSVLGIPEQILEAVADHDAPRVLPAIRDLKDILYAAHAIARHKEGDNSIIPWLREDVDASLIENFDDLLLSIDSSEDEIAEIISAI